MISSQDFKEAGYTQYPGVSGRLADYLLQKRVRDQKGTKYFLNAFRYQLKNGESFQAEINFHDKKGKIHTFCFSKIDSVKELESVVEEIWQKMDYDGYDNLN